MSNARRNTCKLIDAAEDGIISWEEIARECLAAMSESEVSEMSAFVEFFEQDDEEEEDDDTDSWIPSDFDTDEDGEDEDSDEA